MPGREVDERSQWGCGVHGSSEDVVDDLAEHRCIVALVHAHSDEVPRIPWRVQHAAVASYGQVKVVPGLEWFWSGAGTHLLGRADILSEGLLEEIADDVFLPRRPVLNREDLHIEGDPMTIGRSIAFVAPYLYEDDQP